MGMTRAEKETEIKALNERIGGANLVVVTQNKGLTMKDVTAFRNAARKEGASGKVAKNTLARIAIKGTKFEGLGDLLSGPTMLVTSDDPMAAARAVYNFAKTNDKLVIIGGASNDGMMSVDKIKYLATLPSLDALRGKIVGLLQAPGAQIARVVNAYATKDAPQG